MKSINLEKIDNYIYQSTNCITEMDLVKDICNSILSIRKEKNIKTKIPLSEVKIYGKVELLKEKYYEDIIKNEANVKSIKIETNDSSLIEKKIKLNMSICGAKFGKKLPKMIESIKNNKFEIHQDYLLISIEGESLKIENDYIIKYFEIKDSIRDCSRIIGNGLLLVAETRLTDELIEDGIIRDFIHSIQIARKNINLPITQKILLKISNCSEKLLPSIAKNEDRVKLATLTGNIEICDSKNTNIKWQDFESQINELVFSAKFAIIS